MTFLERTFQLHARGTTVQTEVLAGFTTFLTMAYIVLVNPAILSTTGMPAAGVAAATCLAAGIGLFIAFIGLRGAGLVVTNLATLFVAPWAQVIPASVTAPALILVGGMMMAPLMEIDWDDPVIAFVVLKIAARRVSRADWLLFALAALFVARFVYMAAEG